MMCHTKKINREFVYQHMHKEKRGVSKKEEEKMKKALYKALKKKEKGEEVVFSDDIISFFVPLVKKVVKKYASRFPNYDYAEISQQAYHGLLYGLSRVDSDFDNAPTTYIYPWIGNFIQKYIKKQQGLIKTTTMYHSLKVFIKKKMEEGYDRLEIFDLFKPNKERGDNWYFPPEGVVLKHESVKKSTVQRHIDFIFKEAYGEVNYDALPFVEHYEEFKAYEKSTFDFFGGGNLSLRESTQIKKKVLSFLFETKFYSNREKNLFLEFMDISEPIFLDIPPIMTVPVSFKRYNEKRERISRGVYYSAKYGLSVGKIKKIVDSITVDLKELINPEEYEY